MNYTATYSPDDNKLRLYAGGRLPADVYARVKAAGFSWAPKQELFVAPMWTPSREELLLELCGEIGDEDTSLADRAEQRAERFEDYSDKRASDAESARKAVAAIADNIPLGQPILIGHHSEKHARKDAERIENGMRRAVKMWETSQYWTQRAAGAIQHAKYKERPDVRARRIKTIEADQRKQQRTKDRAESLIKIWRDPCAKLKRKDGDAITLRDAVIFLANHDGGGYLRSYKRASGYEGPISLWEAAGGNIHDNNPNTVAIATPEQICAQAVKNHEGAIAWADRWIQHYSNRLAYERAMLADAGGTAADRIGPEVGGGCRCWASPRNGGWSYIQKVNKVSVTVLDNWQNPNDRDGSRNFTRTIPFDKLGALMSTAQVEEARAAGRLVDSPDKTGFYLAKPKPEGEPKPAAPKPDGAEFEAMKETLRAGVKVVSAPQLFPTPAELAERVAELADIRPGQRVLEPSAGTGNLIEAVRRREPGAHVEAVEINMALANALASRCKGVPVMPGDFLEKSEFELGGKFDRIVMNPPFVNGADIKHIQHALKFLKPGGRLVAICANGPRQREALQPLAMEWEDLPRDTFKEAGTGVSTALLIVQT